VTAPRRRLDAELVRRGLAESRESAQRLIADGRVTVGGALAQKSSRMVAASEPVEVLGPPSRFVSRGGDKLAGALDAFAIDVGGVRALDAGASTGGFTDCLLEHGAREVVAVDVGHAQIHERLRADPRVHVHEGVNIRAVEPGMFGALVDLVVADLSFISLRTVLDALLALSEPAADLVLLVKPQFEAGKAEADRGRGVISDSTVWREVLEAVGTALTGRGAVIMGWMVSPVRGAKGNVEFFVHARAPGAVGPTELLPEQTVDAAIAEAALL
jgi:23S rRNA (cytidine1920-2'-O)/16S rRNA (cytidine1409-2'-O)-methyltransferase